jgi:hypothetical protein
MTNFKSDSPPESRRLYQRFLDRVSIRITGKTSRQIEDLQNELTSAHLNAAALGENFAQVQNSLASAKDEITNLKTAIDHANRKAADSVDEAERLRRELQACEVKVSEANRQQQTIIEENNTLRNQFSTLQSRLDAAEVETRTIAGERQAAIEDYRAMRGQREELQRRLDAASAEARTIAGERQAAIDDYRAMQRQRDELQQRLDTEKAELQRITDERQVAIDNYRIAEERREELQQRLAVAMQQDERIAGEFRTALEDSRKLAEERDKLRAERDSLWSMLQGEFAKQLDQIRTNNRMLSDENKALIERLAQAEEDSEILSRSSSGIESPRFPAGFIGITSPKDLANLHRYLEGLRRLYTVRANPRVRGAYIADMLGAFGRNMHFLDDAKFIAAFKRQVRTPADEAKLWRLHVLLWGARNALDLDGDFAECGVFEGFASALLCDALDFGKIDKTFFLYDTFAGLPTRFSSPDERMFAKNQGYDRTGLFEDIVRRFLPYPNVRIVRGVVPDILREQSPKRLAFLHLDMHAAKAEIEALDALYDRVVPGGMILLDDFGRTDHIEQHLAEQAWAASRQIAICELPTGQGLLVKPGKRRRPMK